MQSFLRCSRQRHLQARSAYAVQRWRMRRPRLRARPVLQLLVLCVAVASAASPPPFFNLQPSKVLTVPSSPALDVTTPWLDRAAKAVVALKDALTPAWLASLTKRLAKVGVTTVQLERILITPSVRFLFASSVTGLPQNVADVMALLQNPQAAVGRVAFLPFQWAFKTQYLVGYDAILNVARPGTTVPVTPGLGQRGGVGRRLLGGTTSSSGDVAALRQALLERVIAEAPALIAQFQLGPVQQQRSFAGASNSAGVLAPLLTLDPLSTAMRLLDHLSHNKSGSHNKSACKQQGAHPARSTAAALYLSAACLTRVPPRHRRPATQSDERRLLGREAGVRAAVSGGAV